MQTETIGSVDHLCFQFPDLAEHLRREVARMEAETAKGYAGVTGQFRAFRTVGPRLVATDYSLHRQLLEETETAGVPEYHLAVDPYGGADQDRLKPRPASE